MKIGNYQAYRLIARREPFQGSNFYGEWIKDYKEDEEVYVVYSYSTAIAEWRRGVWIINETRYSITTARHMDYVKRALYAYAGEYVSVYYVSRGERLLYDNIMHSVALDRFDRLAASA